MKKFLRCNGYILLYKPKHPRAFSKGKAGKNGLAGYVYEHIYVAERSMHRRLRPEEDVHHMDLDRSNNSWDNLLVLENTQHGKLHGFLKSIGLKENNVGHSQRKYSKIPRCCICKFPLRKGQDITCSIKCDRIKRKNNAKVKVSCKKLHKQLSKHSWVKVAAYYGLSDNGLRKHAKSIGLTVSDYKGGKFVGYKQPEFN